MREKIHMQLFLGGEAVKLEGDPSQNPNPMQLGATASLVADQKKEYRRLYRQCNRDKILAIERRYRERNREKLNARSREWVKNNKDLHRQRKLSSRRKKPDHYRQRNQEYHHAHKAQRSEQRRRSLAKHPERPRLYAREYRKKHHAKVRAYMNQYFVGWRAKQRADNPLFLLTDRLRSRLRRALIEGNAKKSASTMELLGCSIEHFRAHIESLFLPGMTWENRQQWHLDHKVPIVAFDITTPEGQRAAFHWTNIQPLWENDNRRKSDRLPDGASARKACKPKQVSLICARE